MKNCLRFHGQRMKKKRVYHLEGWQFTLLKKVQFLRHRQCMNKTVWRYSTNEKCCQPNFEETVKERILITEKPCSGSICIKSFSKDKILTKHIRREKQFSCSFCFKTFLEKSNLKKHMLIHTSDKPFACHICNKLFSLNHEVKIHMRTHVEAVLMFTVQEIICL